MGAFYEIGCALLKIRDSRLYRDTHGTFEEYCRDRWDMGRDYADRIISSSNIVALLNADNCQQIPTNEAQARPLTKLEPEQQKEAWEMVLPTKRKQGQNGPIASTKLIIPKKDSENSAIAPDI